MAACTMPSSPATSITTEGNNSASFSAFSRSMSGVVVLIFSVIYSPSFSSRALRSSMSGRASCRSCGMSSGVK